MIGGNKKGPAIQRFVGPFGIWWPSPEQLLVPRAGSEKISLSLACGGSADLLVAQIPPEIPSLTSYCGLQIPG
jgi:hypothetical protein